MNKKKIRIFNTKYTNYRYYFSSKKFLQYWRVNKTFYNDIIKWSLNFKIYEKK